MNALGSTQRQGAEGLGALGEHRKGLAHGDPARQWSLGREKTHSSNTGFAFNIVGHGNDFPILPLFSAILGEAFFGAPPFKFGAAGRPAKTGIWLSLQLAPLACNVAKYLLWFVKDPLLHTFSLPTFVAKPAYKALYAYFESDGATVLEEAEKVTADARLVVVVFVVASPPRTGSRIVNSVFMCRFPGDRLFGSTPSEDSGAKVVMATLYPNSHFCTGKDPDFYFP
ncbi:hypothetical protein KSP40_PGU021012 [Platanthera guangdongensis]|uniref:Uncharacterized protein n=1 Tax=Platanthera guangdongensis TaxID=2320717 RepID=A0ABR2LZQ1_9ASPA